MTWVKFHGELRQGAKRGLSRATRFIFMELCHEARPGRGALDLPVGMSDVDALQDILGGDRREVREALAKLTTGEEPMIVIDGPAGARRLTIPSWQRWNAGAFEPAGASTQRSRRSRATIDERSGNGEATVMQRPLHDDATTVAGQCNDRSSGDQIRGEKSSRAAGDTAPADHRDHGPPQRRTTQTDSGRAVLETLKASEALRGLATLQFAERLAAHAGDTARLSLEDVLQAVRQADAKEANRLAVGEPPRERGVLVGMVTGFVNTARRGDSKPDAPSRGPATRVQHEAPTPAARAAAQATVDALVAEKRARLADVPEDG